MNDKNEKILNSSLHTACELEVTFVETDCFTDKSCVVRTESD